MSEIIEFEADELIVGMRGTDKSPKVTFMLGEHQKSVAARLYELQGDGICKVSVEIE